MTKKSIQLKSMLRSPLRTTLFVFLIALVTFAFSGQAFEGLIVNREIHRLSEQYKAVGTLMPMEPWDWDVREAVDLLEESTLVASTENLRLIPGVMSDIYTPDIDRRSPFPSRMFVYGTLVNKHMVNMGQEDVPDWVGLPFDPYLQLYFFDIYVDYVKASLPEYVSASDTLRFFLIDYDDQLMHVYQEAEVGQRYFVHGQYGKNMRGLPGSVDRPAQFPPGNEPDSPPFPKGSDLLYLFDIFDLMLRPMGTAEIYLYPVPGTSEMTNAEILEQVYILGENIHTVFLRPTKDMASRPEVITSMFITEGRFLDSNDYENSNPVAVIRAEFAALRGLRVGDTLTMHMREETFATEYIIPYAGRWFPTPNAGVRLNWEMFVEELYGGDGGVATAFTQTQLRFYEVSFPANRSLYAGPDLDNDSTISIINIRGMPYSGPFIDGIAYEGMLFVDGRGVDEIMNLEMATGYIVDNDYNWRNRETSEITLEIVGIYGTLDRLSNFITLSYNNVFVPDSVVPEHWTQDTLYRNYSFNLYSPADEEEFTLNYQGILEEIGFWPSFIENDWDDFVASTTTIQSGILVRILAFGLLIFVVNYLVIFLYFLRSKKEFAISRALGLRKKSALLGIMLPMLLMGILGVVTGGVSAWHFAIRRAETTLKQIEGAVFTHPPAHWIWVAMGFLFMLIVIICGNEARKLARYSELELLQGNVSTRNNKKKMRRKGKKSVASEKETEKRADLKEIDIVSESVVGIRDSLCMDAGSLIEERDNIGRENKNLIGEKKCIGHDKLYLDMEMKNFQATSISKKRTLSISFIIRTVTRHILRKPFKSVISASVALGFIAILSLIPVSIIGNNQQIDILYDSTIVTGTMLVDPSSGISRQGSIPHRLLQNITELAPCEVENREGTTDVDESYNYTLNNEHTREYFVGSYYAEARHPVAVEAVRGTLQTTRMNEENTTWTNILGFNNLGDVEEFHDVELIIEFTEGFESTIFGNANPREPVLLISHDFREELSVNLGDYVLLAPADNLVIPHEMITTNYQIVGFFENPGGFPPLITPLEILQYHVGDALNYDRVEFGLNTYFNRELDLFEEAINELFESTEPRFIFILRDHILRGVVEPLEQNVAMMEALYPVIFVLAIIIAMGLTILLLLPSMKDMAVMRTLGVTKSGVVVILGLEQMVLCVIGLILGMAVSVIAFGWTNIIGALLYLSASMLAGAILCIILAKRKPLELLQVKE